MEEQQPAADDFQQLLEVAGKLRECAPDAQRRKRLWEGAPVFLQNSLVGAQDPHHRLRTPAPAATEERVRVAATLREEGNDLFRREKVAEAIVAYERAAACFRYLRKVTGDGGDDLAQEDALERGAPQVQKEARTLLVAVYANLAAAYLRVQRWTDAARASDAALKLEPCHAKALVRGARAREALEDLDGAVRLAARAAEEDESAQAYATALRRRRARENKAQMETFGGMFDRGHLYDDRDGEGEGVDAATTDAAGEFVVRYLRNEGLLKGAQLAAEAVRMREGAEEYGLDLADKDVQEEMLELQRARLSGELTEENKEEFFAAKRRTLLEQQQPQASGRVWRTLRAGALGVAVLLVMRIVLWGMRFVFGGPGGTTTNTSSNNNDL